MKTVNTEFDFATILRQYEVDDERTGYDVLVDIVDEIRRDMNYMVRENRQLASYIVFKTITKLYKPAKIIYAVFGFFLHGKQYKGLPFYERTLLRAVKENFKDSSDNARNFHSYFLDTYINVKASEVFTNVRCIVETMREVGWTSSEQFDENINHIIEILDKIKRYNT